jgi:AmiR/NasT family two-component response regulator
VAAIVLLNVISPSKLASELELFGHQVCEALAVSEVPFLCEQHKVDVVVIATEVENDELIEKQLRGTVMRLKSNADAAYVDW